MYDMSVQEPFVGDRPNTGRMYDYMLHGTANFEVDRAAADEVLRMFGEKPRILLRENRDFQGRAVEHLASVYGVSQFIDIGSALPTVDHTHHVAGRVDPGARVLYAEYDEVVVELGQRILAEEGATGARLIQADMRDPAAILDHPQTHEIIDFAKPVAVLFIAALHCLRDTDEARDIVTVFREKMAPGSFLVLSHLATPYAEPEEIRMMDEAYENASFPLIYRDLPVIESFFEGFDFLQPGLVPAGTWHPGAAHGKSIKKIYAGVGAKRG